MTAMIGETRAYGLHPRATGAGAAVLARALPPPRSPGHGRRWPLGSSPLGADTARPAGAGAIGRPA